MASAYKMLNEFKVDSRGSNQSHQSTNLSFVQESNFKKKCFGCGMPNHTLKTCPKCSISNNRGPGDPKGKGDRLKKVSEKKAFNQVKKEKPNKKKKKNQRTEMAFSQKAFIKTEKNKDNQCMETIDTIT